MSHFTVLVALPKETPLEGVEEALGTVLEPWNENTEVEPYRVYEDGRPEDHWGHDSTYENALPPAEGDAVPLTWEAYVPAFNARWPKEKGGDGLEYDAETGRAYHMTTYNPNSKWDWWQVGGRWSNALLAKPSVDLSALLWSPSHWTEEHGNHIPKGRDAAGHYHCNGGRLMDLDLDAMRDAATAKATEEYDEFAAAIGDLIGETKPWGHFYDLAQAGAYDERVAELNASILSIELPEAVKELVGDRGKREVHPRDIARQEYNAQPGIVRLNEHERYKHFFGCVIDKFALGREEYIARATRNFLPGYAMVTLDGEWLSCGDMGWWGMGSDSDGTVDAHKMESLAYLRSLDPETVVVLVDCHI